MKLPARQFVTIKQAESYLTQLKNYFLTTDDAFTFQDFYNANPQYHFKSHEHILSTFSSNEIEDSIYELKAILKNKIDKAALLGQVKSNVYIFLAEALERREAAKEQKNIQINDVPTISYTFGNTELQNSIESLGEMRSYIETNLKKMYEYDKDGLDVIYHLIKQWSNEMDKRYQQLNVCPGNSKQRYKKMWEFY